MRIFDIFAVIVVVVCVGGLAYLGRVGRWIDKWREK